jgi:hypothetical protein
MIPHVLPLALEVSDNMDFGELIVGVGTLALAAITGLLAWKTSASVATAKVSAEAARESAKAERDSVEAMAMPYVIAVPTPISDLTLHPYAASPPEEIHRERPLGDDRGLLRLRLRNLGSGPTIATNVHLISDEVELLQKLPRHIPIAANDFSDEGIRMTGWPATPTMAVLQVEYLHSNGRSYRTYSEVTVEDDMLRCYTFRRSLAEDPAGV